MSHTPGPWKVGTRHFSEIVSESEVKSTHPRSINASEQEDEVKYYGGYLVAESVFLKENAQLIASAPELLEACQKAYEVLEAISSNCGNNLQVYGWHLNGDPEPFDNFIDDNMDGNELDLLFKVISKAKGEKINE
jgi:hypothetical protein